MKYKSTPQQWLPQTFTGQLAYITYLQADTIFTFAQISEDMIEDLVVDYQTFEGIRVHSSRGYVERLCTVDLIGDLK
jgi:hypothetical protein